MTYNQFLHTSCMLLKSTCIFEGCQVFFTTKRQIQVSLMTDVEQQFFNNSTPAGHGLALFQCRSNVVQLGLHSQNFLGKS